EADGGFGQFFIRPGEEADGTEAVAAAAGAAGERGLTDEMGQLRHSRGGRFDSAGAASLQACARPARLAGERRDSAGAASLQAGARPARLAGERGDIAAAAS